MSDVVEAARERLNALKSQTPPRRKSTKKEQIKALETEIRELIKSGWSTEKIAQALSEGGLEITPGALKNQLYKIGREAGTATKAVSPKTARPQTPAPAPAPQAEAEDEEREDAQ